VSGVRACQDQGAGARSPPSGPGRVVGPYAPELVAESRRQLTRSRSERAPPRWTRRLCGPHSGCWTPTSRTSGRHDDLKRRLDRQRARADRARASTSTWTPPTPSASPPSSPRSSDSEPPGRSQSGVCGGMTRPASRRCDACLCGLYCCVPGPDAHVKSGGPVAAFEQFLEVLIAVWGVRARQSPYDQRHQHAADPARIEVQRERDT
jgi:hypothetical protein